MKNDENKKTKKTKKKVNTNRAIDDPHGLARSWLRGLEGRGNGVRVLHHRDEYLKWEGDAYREIPAGDLRKQLVAHAENKFIQENKKN